MRVNVIWKKSTVESQVSACDLMCAQKKTEVLDIKTWYDKQT